MKRGELRNIIKEELFKEESIYNRFLTDPPKSGLFMMWQEYGDLSYISITNIKEAKQVQLDLKKEGYNLGHYYGVFKSIKVN